MQEKNTLCGRKTSGTAQRQIVARDFVDRGGSGLAHDGAQFPPVNLQNRFHTGLAKSA
jgi:hypothetical protein